GQRLHGPERRAEFALGEADALQGHRRLGQPRGSLLLWVLILTIFGAAVAGFGRNLPPSLKARVLGVQAWVAIGFFSFTLLTSNPFERVWPPPLDGNDLNPL